MHLFRCNRLVAFHTALPYAGFPPVRRFSSIHVAFLIGEIPWYKMSAVPVSWSNTHTHTQKQQLEAEKTFHDKTSYAASGYSEQFFKCEHCACSGARTQKIPLITIQFVFYWHPLTCIPFHAVEWVLIMLWGCHLVWLSNIIELQSNVPRKK